MGNSVHEDATSINSQNINDMLVSNNVVKNERRNSDAEMDWISRNLRLTGFSRKKSDKEIYRLCNMKSHYIDFIKISCIKLFTYHFL